MHAVKLCLSARATLLTLGLLLAQAAWGQTIGAAFGEVVQLGYTPSDIILDESRQCLYLVNTNANRVDTENPHTQPGRPLARAHSRSSSG